MKLKINSQHEDALMRLLNLIKTWWLPCTLLTLAVITICSLRPVSVTDMPGGDKTWHMLAYAALMFPVGLHRPKRIALIFLFFIFYSGMIELIQPYVNRSCEGLDLVANILGLASGLLLAEATRRLNGCKV